MAIRTLKLISGSNPRVSITSKTNFCHNLAFCKNPLLSKVDSTFGRKSLHLAIDYKRNQMNEILKAGWNFQKRFSHSISEQASQILKEGLDLFAQAKLEE